VTGFGLLGHSLELARGAGLTARIDSRTLPVLPGVADFAAQGVFTGASTRNWASYGASVQLASGTSDAQRALLTDPQTSGGLLVSCTPETVQQVLDLFARHGFADASRCGPHGSRRRPGGRRLSLQNPLGLQGRRPCGRHCAPAHRHLRVPFCPQRTSPIAQTVAVLPM
jgi:hypothetical protein